MVKFSFRHCTRLLILVVLTVTLGGCLGIGVETRFNSDGSGTIVSKMRVSKMVLEMGSEEETGLSIPTSKEDIEARFTGKSGIRLVEVTEEETEEDIIITSIVEFDSIESVVDSNDSPIETGMLQTTSEGTMFSMKVGEAKDTILGAEDSPFAEAGLDESMLAMIEAFLEGYEIEYRVTAPSKITRHTIGDVDADGMSVTFKMPMAEYFVLSEPIVFEVVW